MAKSLDVFCALWVADGEKRRNKPERRRRGANVSTASAYTCICNLEICSQPLLDATKLKRSHSSMQPNRKEHIIILPIKTAPSGPSEIRENAWYLRADLATYKSCVRASDQLMRADVAPFKHYKTHINLLELWRFHRAIGRSAYFHVRRGGGGSVRCGEADGTSSPTVPVTSRPSQPASARTTNPFINAVSDERICRVVLLQ